MDANTAMTVVGGAAGYKVLEMMLSYFFKRFTRDDFLTRDDCNQCSKSDDTTIEQLTAEITSIKKILLILASKAGIPPEQISELVR